MIGSLFGTISEKMSDLLLLEVMGVGYELAVTTDDWGGAKVGTDAKFYVYEQIREDAHNLFGFSELSTKQLFIQLVAVNGIGPKLALQTLSAAGPARLRQAIASGDPTLLKGITGVGPKTAARLVSELKGKVDGGQPGGLAPVTDAAYQALVALGYTPSQATAAVADLPDDVTSDQERVKLALKAVQRAA